MKKLKLMLCTLLMCCMAMSAFAETSEAHKLTADDVYKMAATMTIDDQDALKHAYDALSPREKSKLISLAIDDAKEAHALGKPDASVGMYILAVLLPPVAVAIHTDLGMPTVWNILWTLLAWLPGVIHAFYILQQ